MNFLEVKKMMHNDPIVEEVRRVRREILASHGGSFTAMSQDVMKRQWHSGHEVIRFGQNKQVPGIAPNIYPIPSKQ